MKKLYIWFGVLCTAYYIMWFTQTGNENLFLLMVITIFIIFPLLFTMARIKRGESLGDANGKGLFLTIVFLFIFEAIKVFLTVTGRPADACTGTEACAWDPIILILIFFGTVPLLVVSLIISTIYKKILDRKKTTI